MFLQERQHNENDELEVGIAENEKFITWMWIRIVVAAAIESFHNMSMFYHILAVVIIYRLHRTAMRIVPRLYERHAEE